MNAQRHAPAWFRTALALLGTLDYCSALSAAEPVALPAEARILDHDILFDYDPRPVISPDGRWVAYVSKGCVRIASVAGDDARQIVEVKETRGYALARLQNPSRDGQSEDLSQFTDVQRYATRNIVDLQWTHNSKEIAFCITSRDDANKTTSVDFWLAGLDDSRKQLVHIVDGTSNREIHPPGILLTRDHRFLVFTRRHPRPLIWDVAANKPRATPFLMLTPSPTSDRWVGVEKDTRQLVIVNENFDVVQRFDEVVPTGRFGFDLDWSPDERFVIWRQQIGFDYYSNWGGCRFDLKTHERLILTGDYMDEFIQFTGSGGEFLRAGVDGEQGQCQGLEPNLAYFQIVPHGEGFPQYLWRFQANPSDAAQHVLRMGVALVAYTPDHELFAIGLPRREGPVGSVLHLLDRERHLWRLSAQDNEKYVSPYDVVGFAENGKTLIGYDEKCLLAIPVDAIQAPENDARAAAEAARAAARRQKVLPRSWPRAGGRDPPIKPGAACPS